MTRAPSLSEPGNAEVLRRFLRPRYSTARIIEYESAARDAEDAREAWEVWVARGMLPEDWMGPRAPYARVEGADATGADPRDPRRDAALVASTWETLLTAAALADEALARARAWDEVARPRERVLRVDWLGAIDARMRTGDAARLLAFGYSVPAVSTAAEAAALALRTADAWPDRPFAYAGSPEGLAVVLRRRFAWYLAARKGLRVPWGYPFQGRRFRELRSPFAPIAELYALGYAVRLDGDVLVVEVPRPSA